MCLLHRLRLPRLSASELATSFHNAEMEPAWSFILEKAEMFAKEPCLAQQSQTAGIPMDGGYDAEIGKIKSELRYLQTEVDTMKQEEPHRRKAPRMDPDA